MLTGWKIDLLVYQCEDWSPLIQFHLEIELQTGQDIIMVPWSLRYCYDNEMETNFPVLLSELLGQAI